MRIDGTHKQERGILTYITSKISFSQPKTSNISPIELHSIKIHHPILQQLHIINMHILPKHHKKKRNSIISSTFTIITKLPNTIITADANSHFPLYYSPTKDQKG